MSAMAGKLQLKQSVNIFQFQTLLQQGIHCDDENVQRLRN